MPGYVSKNMEWAAIPFTVGQFIVCHKGQQVHLAKDYDDAIAYIQKHDKPKRKRKKS